MIPSYDKRINRKVRVFISSTFSDMQTERNIIVHSVFPRLRKTFSDRLIDITEVDLRWGIPEENSENSRILEICIGEVLHCAPFFVGIIGDRYGSIADDSAIDGLPPAYKKALGEDVPYGLSLTELEMRAGVFVPNNVDYSCFFLKQDVRESAELQPEVSRLAENVRRDYPSYTYANGAEFEERLFCSLRDYINKVIPEELTAPYGDESYFSHLRLLKNNTYRYIPDNYFIARVERKIGQYRTVYLQGGKGMGKSACMSYLAKEEGVERDGCVFFHFAAAGSQSARLENVFFRLRRFLQAELGRVSGEEDDHSAVIDLLGTADKRIVIYVDALDQLDDATAIYKLFALAERTEKVCVVCSGTETYPRIMGDQAVVMKPLSADQIAQIVNGTLIRYGKRLSRKLKQEVLKKENCGNPLFLQALLSQLLVYGAYDTFEDFFHHLLEAETFGELFQTVVLRVKAYFSECGIQESKADLALALIVHSRCGITENTLQELLDVLPVARSVFLTAIDLFTLEDDGRIRFNHDLIAAAAGDMLRASGLPYERIAGDMLTDYYRLREGDWHRYSELPFQLRRAERYGELLEELCCRDCYAYLARHERHTLIGYFSCLVDRQRELGDRLSAGMDAGERLELAELLCLGSCFHAAIAVLEGMEELAPPLAVRRLEILARSQYKLARDHYRDAIATYERLLADYRSLYSQDPVGYASRAYFLAVAYKSAGEFARATPILRECVEIFTRYGVCSEASVWVMDVYGSACYNSGQMKRALEILDKVVSDCTCLFGRMSSELAWAYCYGWNTLYAVGDKVNAIKMVRSAYEIYDQLYSGRGTKLAWAAVNAGSAALIQGQSEEAEEYYRFSIRENDAVIPEEQRPHVYSLTAYADLAVLLEQTGRHEEAVSTARFAWEQSAEKNGEGHVYTANILLILGILEKDTEKLLRALELYRGQEEPTPDVFLAQVCLARTYVLTGEHRRAAETVEACAEAYFREKRETELITYLILETLEKVSGELPEERADALDELYRYDDYSCYITHNNNSQLVPIPQI